MILYSLLEHDYNHNHNPYIASSNALFVDGCVGGALSTEDPEGTFMSE